MTVRDSVPQGLKDQGREPIVNRLGAEVRANSALLVFTGSRVPGVKEGTARSQVTGTRKGRALGEGLPSSHWALRPLPPAPCGHLSPLWGSRGWGGGGGGWSPGLGRVWALCRSSPSGSQEARPRCGPATLHGPMGRCLPPEPRPTWVVPAGDRRPGRVYSTVRGGFLGGGRRSALLSPEETRANVQP